MVNIKWMKANELRIGNWVFKDISTLCANAFFPHKITWRDLGSEDTFVPIPLTPKILEKCGFVYSDKGNLGFEFNQRMVLVFHDGNIAELDLVQDGNRISFKHGHVKYLHQLQDLYFALTGEDLDANIIKDYIPLELAKNNQTFLNPFKV